MPPSFGGSATGTSVLQPGLVESLSGALEQQPVLEHAAREDDGVEPPLAAGSLGRRRRRRRRARGESAPRRSRRSPSHPGRPGARGSRGAGSSTSGASPSPSTGTSYAPRSARVRGALELGRGLTLVGHLRPDAAERRDGVEEAAGAGGHRRPGARLDDSAHRLPVRRARPRREVRRESAGARRPERARATTPPSARAPEPRGRRRAGGRASACRRARIPARSPARSSPPHTDASSP